MTTVSFTLLGYCHDARMRSGVYVDPWDPYCGYIQCDQNGNATRHYCEKGSWTGFKVLYLLWFYHGATYEVISDGYCACGNFNSATPPEDHAALVEKQATGTMA